MNNDISPITNFAGYSWAKIFQNKFCQINPCMFSISKAYP